MSSCIFCKIVRQEIPCQIVYENDQILIIKDIEPVAPVHLLAIPKIHIDNVCDPQLLDSGLLNSLLKGIQEVVQNLGIKDNGFRLVINYGSDAGEAIGHLHWHIIAGRKLAWPPG